MELECCYHTNALSGGVTAIIGAYGPSRGTNDGRGRNRIRFMGRCHVRECCHDSLNAGRKGLD